MTGQSHATPGLELTAALRMFMTSLAYTNIYSLLFKLRMLECFLPVEWPVKGPMGTVMAWTIIPSTSLFCQ